MFYKRADWQRDRLAIKAELADFQARFPGQASTHLARLAAVDAEFLMQKPLGAKA